MSEDLEKSKLFWWAEEPYLKILANDAEDLWDVVEAARACLVHISHPSKGERLEKALSKLNREDWD